MISIARTGSAAIRVQSDAKLSVADFRGLAAEIGVTPFVARKSGLIAARAAQRDERIETHWNGKETVNTARPGDLVVTNLDARGAPLVDRAGNQNVYVILADAFPTLYAPADVASAAGTTYRARATVEAIKLAGGFEIIAPWGETQRADSGYLILNGVDVYGNNAETFEQTYVAVAPT